MTKEVFTFLCLFIDNLHARMREEHLQYFRWKVMHDVMPPLPLEGAARADANEG